MNNKLLSLAVAGGLLAGQQGIAQEVSNGYESMVELKERVVNPTSKSLADTISLSDVMGLQRVGKGEINPSDIKEFLNQHEDELRLYVEKLGEGERVDLIFEYLKGNDDMYEVFAKMANRDDVKEALILGNEEEVMKIFEKCYARRSKGIAMSFLRIVICAFWFALCLYGGSKF